MTRKDYVLIAEALKEARMRSCDYDSLGSNAGRVNAMQMQEHCARELAEALGRDNPRFDRERFLRAAGVQS